MFMYVYIQFFVQYLRILQGLLNGCVLIFYRIGGLGYLIPAILFWFLGTADIQKWNDIKKSHPDIVTQESQASQASQETQESQAPTPAESDYPEVQKTKL